MTVLNASREQFEKWCPIKITDEAKAPKAAALVKAYWTAWQAGQAAGRRESAELVASLLQDEAEHSAYAAQLLACIRVALSEAKP